MPAKALRRIGLSAGGRRGTTTISAATAREFRLSSPEGSRPGSRWRSVLVTLDADSGKGGLTGFGEATHRSRGVSADEVAASWSRLQVALESLHGRQISAHVGRARRDLAAIVKDLDGGAAREGTSAGGRLPSDKSPAAVEMALVDLAAKASGVPLAILLGGRLSRLGVTASEIDAQANRRTLERQLLRRMRRFPMARFGGASDWNQALELMSWVASVYREAQQFPPIWIDFEAKLDDASARKLVSAVVDEVTARRLPRHVVLEQPVAADDHGLLRELQQVANQVEPRGGDAPGVVIMADEAVRSLADGLAISGSGGVRAVSIDPARVGGLLAARTLAEALTEQSPDVRIAVSAPRAGTIVARATAELAAALPRLDYFALTPATVADSVRSEPSLKVADGNRLNTGEGSGLGIAVDVSPVVHLLRRETQVPSVPERASSLRPNEFDNPPIAEFDIGALDSHLLERSALTRGMETVRLAPDAFIARSTEGRAEIGFLLTKSPSTSAPAWSIARDKELTRTVLDAAGVEVPRGATFDLSNVDGAVEFARSLGRPVVVKPRDGRKGKGVSTDLSSDEDVRRAIGALGEAGGSDRVFIVEEHIVGADYRFFVVGNRVVSVLLRKNSSVVGDGRSTIIELALQKNLTRLRMPNLQNRLVRLEEDARTWLRRQGLTVESVPVQGQEVKLSGAANIASGGESFEVLSETHEAILEMAVGAVRAIPGLDHAGVDIIGDHRLPPSEHRAAVIEVNASPGMGSHHFPIYGPPRNVAGELVARTCEVAGYPAVSEREQLNVRIAVTGQLDASTYLSWLTKLTERGHVDHVLQRTTPGGVELTLSGAADKVAVVVAKAVKGPRGTRVSRVVTTHEQGG